MPLPTVPYKGGMNRAFIGCATLLAATKQWQIETGRDERGAIDRIDWPESPLIDSKIVVPSAFVYGLRYVEDGDNSHRYGALLLNVIVPGASAYAASEYEPFVSTVDERTDAIERLEACIDEMWAKKGQTNRLKTSETYWQMGKYELLRVADQDIGGPAIVDPSLFRLVTPAGGDFVGNTFGAIWEIDFGY